MAAARPFFVFFDFALLASWRPLKHSPAARVISAALRLRVTECEWVGACVRESETDNKKSHTTRREKGNKEGRRRYRITPETRSNSRAITAAIKCAPPRCTFRNPSKEIFEVTLAATEKGNTDTAPRTAAASPLLIFILCTVINRISVASKDAQDRALDRSAIPAITFINPLLKHAPQLLLCYGSTTHHPGGAPRASSSTPAVLPDVIIIIIARHIVDEGTELRDELAQSSNVVLCIITAVHKSTYSAHCNGSLRCALLSTFPHRRTAVARHNERTPRRGGVRNSSGRGDPVHLTRESRHDAKLRRQDVAALPQNRPRAAQTERVQRENTVDLTTRRGGGGCTCDT